MMKRHVRMIAVLLVAVTALSCERNQPGEEFLNSEDLCLVIDGRVVHSYDPLTWQIGYNASEKEFRVHNDSMSDYYILVCDHIPTKKGETVTGTLKWSGSSTVNRKSLTLEVVKTDAGGRLWLWSRKSRTAVSVMTLR